MNGLATSGRDGPAPAGPRWIGAALRRPGRGDLSSPPGTGLQAAVQLSPRQAGCRLGGLAGQLGSEAPGLSLSSVWEDSDADKGFYTCEPGWAGQLLSFPGGRRDKVTGDGKAHRNRERQLSCMEGVCSQAPARPQPGCGLGTAWAVPESCRESGKGHRGLALSGRLSGGGHRTGPSVLAGFEGWGGSLSFSSDS